MAAAPTIAVVRNRKGASRSSALANPGIRAIFVSVRVEVNPGANALGGAPDPAGVTMELSRQRRTVMTSRGFLSLVLALPLAGGAWADEGHRHEHPAGEKLGKVDFPVSCNAPAREAFQRAAALLHSFAYEEAERAFGDVTLKDPACAMGYWGVAMTQFHPIWASANPAGAPSPAELKKGSEAAARATALGAKTERERDFIAAVGAYYKDAESRDHVTRATSFEAGMAEVYRKNPQDKEAAILYALAMLGTAWPNDKTYAQQRKAAELLNRVLPEAPEHPGVAHYVIHSFDYPELASVALPAARSYSKIAPSAPHALHMPSHIFTRLGLWDESIASNLASSAAARTWVARLHPGATSFDDLHALDYLEYAYLQGAQDAKAREIVDRLAGVEALDAPNFAAAYALSAISARYVLERRQWAEATALTLAPASFPWARFLVAEANVHFARAIGGARGGDLSRARAGLDRLQAIHAALLEKKDAYGTDQVEIQRRAASAWVARAEGSNDEALSLLRSAAELEDSTEKHPVTPGYLLPAREMLGDLLVELGQAAAAVEAYEASLRTAPRRFSSLYGAAHAAELAGDKAKARAMYAQLESLAAHADGARPELAKLRAFLASGEARASSGNP
jgi:tetratricopeptide (TPR) repeat protein